MFHLFVRDSIVHVRGMLILNHTKNSGGIVTTGIPSLFLIFSVLCLVILSLMALGTSRTDRTSSRNSLDQTSRYYEACTIASHRCAAIEEAFEAFSGGSGEECLRFAREYLSETLGQESTGEGIYTLSVPFSPVLSLHVELEPAASDPESRPVLKIRSWYTAQEGEWTPDLHQDLYIPGQTILSSNH